MLFALRNVNDFRHEVDEIENELVALTARLEKAADFSAEVSREWTVEAGDRFRDRASAHIDGLRTVLNTLDADIAEIRPKLSKAANDAIDSASVNGDLFWSVRDMMRNLADMGKSAEANATAYSEIRLQNELVGQEVLSRAAKAFKAEHLKAEANTERALFWAIVMLVVVLASVALWVFRPMEKVIRQALAEASRSRVKAESADRAKSEFLANMSHEIRTPMNGVLGMTELLAKSELSPRQKAFTDVIVKSGNALLAIINDVLDFSKINAGQLTLDVLPFRLAEAVEDVAALASVKAAEKDLELIVRIDPRLPPFVVGDAGRFRQIIGNMLGNAVKFTETGHVLVDVSGEVVDGVANIKVLVEDTGIGIPADKLETVFEKFAQVDSSSTRRHEGTGLGLAIAARLVDLMGGKMGVESEVGRGTIFWFSASMSVHAGEASAETVPVEVTGARVLVIDDNSVNRTILLEQLGSWGFECVATENGAIGLAFLERSAQMRARVDCVVLDYQMPDMDGLQVAAAMRSDTFMSQIPIVLLTSVDHMDFARLAADYGIAAHLTKPARSSALLGAVVAAIPAGRAATEIGQRELEAEAEGSAAFGRAPSPIECVPQSDAPDYPSSGQIDILVAEDNDVNQLVFEQILNGLGYSYRIVGNGRKAVELYLGLRPRLILMDVSMPEMNGYEASVAIREAEAASGARTPIIGVTAHALKGDRQKCIESGMDDYLPKPISPDRLAAKIHAWLNEAKAAARA